MPSNGIVVNSSKWGKVCVRMYVCLSVCTPRYLRNVWALVSDIDVMETYKPHFAQGQICLTLN